jgi:hypothetical protein
MKNLLRVQTLLIAFLFLNISYADMEHKTGIGSTPKREKLMKQHGCFQEITNLGCVHPREDQMIFRSCLDEKNDQLSVECQSFFEKLYGKRKESVNK